MPTKADLLYEIWYDAIVARCSGGDTANPFPEGTKQHTVWELALEADVERDEWESSPEGQAEQLLDEQPSWERAEAQQDDAGATAHDHERWVKWALDNLMKWYGMPRPPLFFVNAARHRLLSRVHDLAHLPTDDERERGIAPNPAEDANPLLRESPEVARAREEGQRAGRAGVAADQNPFAEPHRWFPTRGYTGLSAGWPHVVRYSGPYGAKSRCGRTLTTVTDDPLDTSQPYVCANCRRAVEAEMKRRATAWEEGRLSTHPK